MVGEIDPETLRDQLVAEAEEPLLVDIRAAGPYAQGHLPGSLNVPMADLPREIDRIADADHVVTICPHGQASIKAARIVAAYKDFDGQVDSLAGGLQAWDGPIEHGDPEQAEAAPAEEDVPF
jgi:rhodanese-related sulfurtransferase